MPSDQQIRDNIVRIAQKYVGSQVWSDGVAKEHYGPNTNKCNLFVYDVLTEAGASPGLPNGWWNHYPPLASQWADPGYAMPHWPILVPTAQPLPGDVIAQSIAYSDASGHVMIMAPNDYVIGTGDRGNGPHGTIEFIPRPMALGPAPLGPERYRRWVP